jgi:exonuclease SbcD
MGPMKFFHAADIHLDSPLRGLDRYEGAPVEQMRGATRRAFENLVVACVEERVDFLLLAGDLYDGGWRDYSTGLFFAAQMARLRESQIPVFIVLGNHDAASQITKRLRLPDNVRELSDKRPESIELPKLGVVLHGQSFATRAVTDDLAARYPDAVAGALNIGLLHTALDGREGHEPYAPTKVPVLESKGYDYWALGHVHEREIIARAPWIVFPGNLQGRHAKETGAKGATLVTVEGGRIADVSHRALDVVRWCVCDVDAAAAEGAADVVELARRALAKAADEADGRPIAARDVVRGATRAHTELVADPERWVNEVRLAARDAAGDGAWVEKVKLSTRAAIDVAALRERDDAIGQLARAVRDLRADDEGLLALEGELDVLKKRLPPELREGEGGALFEGPEAMRELLDDVEQVLLPRLLAHGGKEAQR